MVPSHLSTDSVQEEHFSLAVSARQLCHTAWKLKHKLTQVMLERGQRTRTFKCVMELNDIYLRGEQAGKRDRGFTQQNPFR